MTSEKAKSVATRAALMGATIPEDRDHWLNVLRKGYVGASEAAAFYAGVKSFTDIWTLWHKSKGNVESVTPATPAMEFGSEIEGAIIRFACRQYGLTLLDTPENAIWRSDEYGLAATPDAIALDDEDKLWLIEAKGPWRNWREVAEDGEEVPYQYQIQCQQQMGLTEIPRCLLVASFYAGVPRCHTVEFDPDWWVKHKERAQRFWQSVREHDECPFNPPGTDSADTVLKQLYPEDTGEIITLPPESTEKYRQYLDAHNRKTVADKHEKELKQWFKSRLGDASVGRIPQTNREFTNFKEHRKAEEKPRPAWSGRVARFRKAK